MSETICGAVFSIFGCSMTCRLEPGHRQKGKRHLGRLESGALEVQWEDEDDVARAAGLQPATPGLEGRCSDAAELRPPAPILASRAARLLSRLRATQFRKQEGA